MHQGDWRDQERDRLSRHSDGDRRDYGQADYSDAYRYDPQTRTGYRAANGGRDGDRPPEPRAGWHDPSARPARRDGPSDRVLWAIVAERLEHERRLDLRDVEVIVLDAEVTLNGTVRHKADKRRIEDVADIEGVRNIQNNLRVRERSRWTLF